MLTKQEKEELDALKAKDKPTDAEKTRLEALEAKSRDGDGDGEKSYSENYVEQLRRENAKYRLRAKQADEKLAEYDGIDPEEYRQMKEKQAKAEKDKLAKSGEWEKLREQTAQEHKKEIDKLESELAALKGQYAKLEAELNDTIMGHEVAVQASIAKAINPALVEMVVKTMAKPIKLEDGRRVVRVLDADGNERIDIKTGKPLTVSQLIEELKQADHYAHLFEGGTKGGGSKTVQFGGNNIKNPWKRESYNLTLQGEIVRDNPELAKRLKAEAGI